MAYPPYLKAKARELRTQRQLTLDELVERLALPKTTIWYWIQDLPLERRAPSARQTAARRAASRAAQRRYRLAREAAYEEGRLAFDALSGDPTFRDFICLYIAEGSKRDRNRVALANSDPAVLRIAGYWIRQLTLRRLRAGLQYHADQDPDALRVFWGRELGLVPESIALQRKSNSSQLAGRTWRSRYGVLTVSVYDTHLRARMQAWMDCLRQSWV